LKLFSLGTLVSSINKTDHTDITEIFLKVALNIITIETKSYQNINLFTSDEDHICEFLYKAKKPTCAVSANPG
jgi:hypothetical protein